MRILITGISGLLGNALSQVLTKNHQVFGIYYKDKDLIVENEFAKNFECDITDKNQLFKKAGNLNPEVIVHTVALTDVNYCELNQKDCWKVNVVGTRNIAELARFLGARFIYVSTVSVFSGEKGNYKEEDFPYPQNFYSLTKVIGEEITLSLEKGIVLRINLIGIHPKRKKPANFLEWLVREVQENKNFTLFQDVKVNPLSNFSLAKIIGQILTKEAKEKILHLGTRDVLSKAEIGMMVIKRFPNYKGKVKICSIDEFNSLAKRPKEMWLCPKFIESKLGIKMPYLKDELNKIMISFLRKYEKKV